MWSLTTPTFCMNAYTLVGPTKRYPLAGDRVGLRELGHRRDLGDVEAPECLPERVPFPEYDRPAQPDLEHAQGERLEHRRLVVGAGTPDLRAPAKSRSAPYVRPCLSLESGSRPGPTQSRGAGPRCGVIG